MTRLSGVAGYVAAMLLFCCNVVDYIGGMGWFLYTWSRTLLESRLLVVHVAGIAVCVERCARHGTADGTGMPCVVGSTCLSWRGSLIA